MLIYLINSIFFTHIMKTILVITLLLFGITSCHFTDKKNQNDSNHLPRTGELYQKTPEQIEEDRKQEIADSINMVKMLTLALKIADEKKAKENYTLET